MNPTARTAGNTFKTFALMGALTALLLVIGQLVGGGTGLMFFAIIAIGFNFFAYWFSGPMALKMSRAQEVSEQGEVYLSADPLHRVDEGEEEEVRTGLWFGRSAGLGTE